MRWKSEVALFRPDGRVAVALENKTDAELTQASGNLRRDAKRYLNLADDLDEYTTLRKLAASILGVVR